MHPVELLDILQKSQWCTKGGNGVRIPQYSKRWSSRSAQKRYKICRGGVGSCRSVKRYSLKFLNSKQGIVCQGLVARFWVSKKCFNAAGRDILCQNRMHVLKMLPGGLVPRTSHFTARSKTRNPRNSKVPRFGFWPYTARTKRGT